MSILDQQDKKFWDELHAEIFKATRKDREAQTLALIDKLETLKTEKVEVSNFPTEKEVDLSETNGLLSELIDELKKPVTITLKLK